MHNTDAFDKRGQNINPGGDEESENVKKGQTTSALEHQHSASRSGLLCVT
jgi:hypothetical protein